MVLGYFLFVSSCICLYLLGLRPTRGFFSLYLVGGDWMKLGENLARLLNEVGTSPASGTGISIRATTS